MLGALPAALTFYWRMKMPETARYTALVAKNAKQAAADMSKVLEVELRRRKRQGRPDYSKFLWLILSRICETPRASLGWNLCLLVLIGHCLL
jgi:hypothetical protein